MTHNTQNVLLLHMATCYREILLFKCSVLQTDISKDQTQNSEFTGSTSLCIKKKKEKKIKITKIMLTVFTFPWALGTLLDIGMGSRICFFIPKLWISSRTSRNRSRIKRYLICKAVRFSRRGINLLLLNLTI